MNEESLERYERKAHQYVSDCESQLSIERILVLYDASEIKYFQEQANYNNFVSISFFFFYGFIKIILIFINIALASSSPSFLRFQKSTFQSDAESMSPLHVRNTSFFNSNSNSKITECKRHNYLNFLVVITLQFVVGS
jgi:hypothetical protein